MWLTLDDKDLENNGTDVELDELQLYGGAQLAILNPANAKARISIVIGQMQGDRYVLSVSNSHNASRSVCVIICLLKVHRTPEVINCTWPNAARYAVITIYFSLVETN